MGRSSLFVVLVAPSTSNCCIGFVAVPINLLSFFLICLPVVVSHIDDRRRDPRLNRSKARAPSSSHLFPEKLGRSSFLLPLLTLLLQHATSTLSLSSPALPSEVSNSPPHPPFSLYLPAGSFAPPLLPTGRHGFSPAAPSTKFKVEGSDVAPGIWNSSAVLEPDGSESSCNSSDTAGSQTGVSSDTSDVTGPNSTLESPPGPDIDDSSSSRNMSDSSVDASANSTSAYTCTPPDPVPNNSSSSADTSDSSTTAPENSTSAYTPPNSISNSSSASTCTMAFENSTSAYTPPNSISNSSSASTCTMAFENSTSAYTPPNSSNSSSDMLHSSTQASENSTSAYTPSNSSNSTSDMSDLDSSTQVSENSTSAYTPPNNSNSSPDTLDSSTQASENSTSAYTPSNSSSSASDTSGSPTQTAENSAYPPLSNSSSSSDTSDSSTDLESPGNSASAYTPPNNSDSNSDTSGSSTRTSGNSTSAYPPPNNFSSSSDSTPTNSTSVDSPTPPDESTSDPSTNTPEGSSNATTPTRTGDMNSTDSSTNNTSNSTIASIISIHDFSVLKYGAVGDGATNDTQAFVDAWRAACAVNASNAYVLAPSAYQFLLYPVTFRGPCLAQVTLQVDGIVMAPSDPAVWSDKSVANHWLKFSKVSVTVGGSGTFDGRGQTWWANSCKTNHRKRCVGGPTALGFFTCTNVTVKHVSIVNAQQMHLVFQRSSIIEVNAINISAPGNSPNTDGIHLQVATDVTIENSFIGTGDDCVSVQTGSANVIIRNTTCGPGHGISVGGLGKAHTFASVSNIIVEDVIFNNSTNGVRIKTWQGSSGKAEAFTYRNLRMNNVANPIIIDQYYCDSASSGSCSNFTSNVVISNITYKNITGTSATKNAITLKCSETVACTEITLEDVDLVQTSGSAATSSCTNAFGTNEGTVIPSSCLRQ